MASAIIEKFSIRPAIRPDGFFVPGIINPAAIRTVVFPVIAAVIRRFPAAAGTIPRPDPSAAYMPPLFDNDKYIFIMSGLYQIK